MYAKRLISLLVFILMVAMQACAPSTTRTPESIASAPRSQEQKAPAATQSQRPQPLPTAASRQAAEPTAAPWANNFPAAAPTATAGGLVPDNQFKDAGVNPETNTRYDHLSTFALDVDTASYTVTRKYLNEGMLPPYEAVRVEEFVNAFDQGYAAPKDSAFTIFADGAPAPRGYEAGAYILRFGIQGYRVENFERKPAVLTFVIDVSGSMNMENRLELVKKSLRLLVDRLDGRDSVAIIVYGSEARTVLNPTPGDRHGVILQAIDRLAPEGSTNAEAGLRLGYSYASETYRADSINRVILCSDGVANTGNVDPETILNEVGGFVDQGITLTTIGVGMGNYNDVLLEKLADRGNGSYHYVDTLQEARRVFVDRLTSTLQVIARDAKVQVDFNADTVAAYRLLGYENRAVADQDFRNDTVDAGELGAGHTATALYEIHLKPGAEGRIATVQLRWQDPDTSEVKEINGNFNTWDIAGRFEDTSPRYQMAVTVGEFAEILRQSPYTAEVSLDDLARRADRIANKLGEDEQVYEFAQLVHRAAELSSR